MTKNKYLGGMNMMYGENRKSVSPQYVSEPLSIDSTEEGVYSPSETASKNYAGSSIENPVPNEPFTSDKKIIKNGDLDLKVDNIDKAAEDISKIAKNNGGEIFSSSISQSGNNIKRGNITIKVTFSNFEKTISEIKKIAALVIQESTTGQDITEEYADLQARISNKKAEEQSYVKILDQAQKIDDILAITRQLSTVRGEIERLEGRIKLMNSQTEMSTISISLSEDQDITITDSWRPLQIAKDAFNSLVKMAQGFITFLIVLIVTVIPVAVLYLILIFIIYLIGRKIWQKIKKRKENSAIQ